MGTGVILDFLSCHRHYKELKHFRKVFRRVKFLSMLEVSFISFHFRVILVSVEYNR